MHAGAAAKNTFKKIRGNVAIATCLITSKSSPHVYSALVCRLLKESDGGYRQAIQCGIGRKARFPKRTAVSVQGDVRVKAGHISNSNPNDWFSDYWHAEGCAHEYLPFNKAAIAVRRYVHGGRRLKKHPAK